MRKCNYFPLVGILTSKGNKADSFRGDLAVFKSIQQELMTIGGLSFIFTTEGVHEKDVTGYIFYEKDEKWGKVTFPFPDLIYNKVSSRREEAGASFQSLYDLYMQENKPFFNQRFFDKWECYCILAKSNQIRNYLPETWIYTNINDLLYQLSKYQSLYAKPVNGHKGKGIYKFSYDGRYFHIQRKNKSVKYLHVDFVHEVEKLLKNEQHLLQMEIHTDKIDDCKYDLRILCIYDNGSHKITGIGVRKAAKNSIITHVPNGGDIVSFQSIKDKCPTLLLNRIAEAVGRELTKKYGLIGEYSMDIGLTPEGKPFIFEINSKPMIFDEPDIQKKRESQLVKMFNNLANSTKKK